MYGTGNQIWRQREHISQQAIKEVRPIDIVLIPSERPRVGDFVYVRKYCVLARVADPPDNLRGKYARKSVHVVLAQETLLEKQHSRQAFFKFAHNASTSFVDYEEVVFPIDITFMPKHGVFRLLKSSQLQVV